MAGENDDKTGLRKIYRKSWPFDNLFGTLRQDLTSGGRGIWNDLLDMAKISRVRPGLIAAGKGRAYNHQWLAGFLNVSVDELETTLAKLQETNRIVENGDGIEILNWGKYQSEYDRQKPYRQSGLNEDQKSAVEEQNRRRREFLKKQSRKGR